MALLSSIMPIFTSISTDIWAPDKMWHLLILDTFSFVVDYGVRIVVFTLLLKLVLSPLDFYQRYKMNKNQKITERLKPTMEKLQKQYGNDKQKLSQVQMELNRKEGYSYFSACLPMILTLVIFMTLWASMNIIAKFMSFKEYATLYDAYKAAETATLDDRGADKTTLATEVGQVVVKKLYCDGFDDDWVNDELAVEYGLGEDFKVKFRKRLDATVESTDKVQKSFLWVQNIWAPDVPWQDKAILNWEAFSKQVGDYSQWGWNGLPDATTAEFYNESTYNKVMARLLNDDDVEHRNGTLVLPILVVLLSVGSQILSMFQQKKAGQVNEKGGAATSMKFMTFLMPVMMGFFAIQYASIFTMYMVVNTGMSLLFNVLFTGIIKLIDRGRASRHHGIAVGSTRGTTVSKNSPIIHYVKGANPKAGERPAKEPEAPVQKDRKSKGKAAPVRKGGRPDPNELMSIDMNDTSKRK